MTATFDFTGRRVVVTGGSRGIGRGIAEAFLKAGAAVSICARDGAKLEETRGALSQYGSIHAAPCDLGNASSIAGYVAEAAAALGGIDILVNNVSAISRGDGEEAWLTATSVDLMGTVRMCEAAIPWLEKSPGAAIVHISSITAFRGSVSAPVYAAIKAGLLNYTSSQALSLLPRGIRVNGVAPGSTEAPGHFWEERKLSGDPKYAAALKTQPSGRMGQPDDIADVVMFLASDASRWVVGQTIIADGAQLANGG